MDNISISNIEKFDGTNYSTWSFKLRILLKAKNCFHVVEENAPAEPNALAAWNKSDAEVFNIIVQSLNQQQTIYVMNETTAKGAWQKLAKKYRGDAEDKKITLRRELSNAQWQKEDDVNKYITRIESLAATLSNFGQDISEAEISAYILNGLPHHYRCVKRIFEAMRPSEVTVKQIKNSLLAEEDNKSQQEISTTTAYRTKQNRWQKRCFNCGRQNHLQKDCWFLKSKEKTKYEKRDYRSSENKTLQNKKMQSSHKANKLEDESDSKECLEEKNKIERIGFNFANKIEKQEECSYTRQMTNWTIDSGATCHMTNQINILEDFEKKNCGNVKLADGSNKKSVGVGNITLIKKPEDVKIKDVLFVPELKDNLLSVSKLDEAGMTIKFGDGRCLIYRDGQIIYKAICFNGLYTMNMVTNEDEKLKIAKEVKNDELWHKRFGHLNYDTLYKMHSKNIIRGLEIQNKTHPKCEMCILGKSTRNQYKYLNRPLKNCILELIHIDLIGPITPESLGHSKYILCITDDCSRKVKTCFLKTKGEAAEQLITFIKEIERATERKVKVVRTDNGKEFVNRTLDGFFKMNGIKHELTIPYTPEQAGTAERTNRTILEMARTLLIESKLPKNFWAEAVATAVYIRNRCGTSKLNDKTPEEIWSGRRPTSSHFRVFGCLAYSWIPKELRSKLDKKATPSILMGYYENMKAYRLYDPKTEKFFACKKPVFFEDKTGWEELQKKNEEKETTINETEDRIKLMWSPEERKENNEIQELSRDQSEERETTENNEIQEEPRNQSEEYEERIEERIENNSRRSNRLRQFPNRLQVDPRKNSYCNEATTDKLEPVTYEEATSCKEKKKWKEAIEKELNSLNKMETWKVVKKEKHMNIIKSKWVFRIKRGENEQQKYKARLVAIGYYQRKGIDFLESYSPVMKLSSLRIILAIANIMDLELRQLDVETAYLHGDLKEEVYMEIPKGCDLNKENYCYQLKKSLYGLKQSGRVWNMKLDEELKKMKFKQLETDKCVYMRTIENEFALLGVYVDDLILATTSTKLMEQILNELKTKFAIKDLGEPDNMLGLRIKRNRKEKTITIDQNEYIQKILRKFNMHDAKESKTPMEINLKLENSNINIDNKIPYQSLIGNLMYVVQGTRPDIAFAVHYLSQFNGCYTKTHWTHLKRILRYLKATPDVFIKYKNDSKIYGYTDANWNNSEDGKSVSGYLFLFGSSPITWSSNKQRIIALSTCESEYVALCEATKEAKWLRNFFKELNLENQFINKEFLIFCDNQAAITIMNNTNYNKRSKHIGLKYLYCKNEIEEGNIKVKYISTNLMAADGLTKTLPNVKIKRTNELMGIMDKEDEKGNESSHLIILNTSGRML